MLFGVAVTLLTGVGQFSPATAQAGSSWNGTWTGFWGGASATSVTIVGGRLARYEFKGRPVPVTISKIEGNMLTFGIAGNYAIRIIKTSQNTATASYESLRNNDTAAADLTRN
jgi:hypothetical protein